MMRSMYAGVSGLRTHQFMIDVTANNIANVNTPGFKASRVQFTDVLSQQLEGTGGATALTPLQVGLGVRIDSTSLVFTQGASQLTERSLDIAIEGNGFLVTRAPEGVLYTRLGSLAFDREGFLIDAQGGNIQGWSSQPGEDVETNVPPSDVQLVQATTIPPEPTQTVFLDGNLSVEELDGETIVSGIEVIDQLGAQHRITIEFTKVSDGNWTVDTFDEDGNSLSGGPQAVTFDAVGALTAPTTITAQIPGDPSQTYDIQLSHNNGELTQFGTETTYRVDDQDGVLPGTLQAFRFSDEGFIIGVYDNGQSRNLAAIALATFDNPSTLLKAGENRFQANPDAGPPNIGLPGAGGRGTISAGTLEMSNVDLAREFTDLIVAQRGFQANSRVITTSDELIQELVNLKR